MLWEITTYKDCEQHISDSDDEKEEKPVIKYKKKSTEQFERSVLDNWIFCGSGFDCTEVEKDKIHDSIHYSEEEALIETTSHSDDDNLQSTQLSVSEVSCNSNKSYFCQKHYGYEDFHDDSSECSNSTPISEITGSSQINFHSKEQVRNISDAISPPSSPSDNTNCNAKGSEWLLTIPWQSTSQKEICIGTEFDSGKKKKKYTRGGFADQLHKLLKREKSAKAFWDHHNYDSKSPLCGGKEAMILQLMETVHSYGTVICKAFALKSHHLNELNLLQKNSVNCTDSETNFLNANNIINEGTDDNYIVLLDYNQYEKLNLSTGSIVQLFPPWKVLHMKNLAAPLLLCTYFLQAVKGTDHLFVGRKW